MAQEPAGTLGGPGHSSGGLGFWLTGACYGPLLPGFLAIVIDMFDPIGLSGTALGLMLAGLCFMGG